MLEQRIKRDDGYLRAIVKNFQQSRKVKDLPEQLGIDGHPSFVADRVSSWSIRKQLVEVMYRVDLPSLFEAKQHFTKRHSAASKKRARTAEVALQHLGTGHGGVIKDRVLHAALVDHFRVRAEPSMLYEIPLPVGDLAFENLGEFFGHPSSRTSKSTRTSAPGQEMP